MRVRKLFGLELPTDNPVDLEIYGFGKKEPLKIIKNMLEIDFKIKNLINLIILNNTIKLI